jgi:hypothetical protein
MTLRHASAVAGSALVALMLSATDAWTQARVIVAPSAGVGMVYDDNVFSAPQGEETTDTILRLTPGLAASRETPRTAWFGSYSFDAERFTDHPTLTTPFARQTGVMRAKVASSPDTTVTLNGTYDNTIYPSELNLTTGLQTGRRRAWAWTAGPEFSETVSARTKVSFSYTATASFLEPGPFLPDGQQLVSHAADLTIAHDLTPRDEFRVRPFLRDFEFNDTGDVPAYGLVLGWTHKITPLTRISLEAGPRLTVPARWDEVKPEVDLLLARQTGASEVSLEYARTLTTAVGFSGVMDTQRVAASAGYHNPRAMDFTATAAVYSNAFADSSTRVYLASVDLTRRMIGVFWFSTSYSFDIQRGRLGVLLLPDAISPFVNPGLTPIAPDTPIMRNVLMIRLLIAPELRPTGKFKPPPQDSRDPHSSRSVR